MLLENGWKDWNISRDRVESVAEHIYGTCILAIAIESEYDLDIDLEKVILMLVIHELEEIYIGDLTPFDEVALEEKRKIGKEAVEKILEQVTKKEEYFNLTQEFNEAKTKEAKFAKVCDKLECDIQCKVYCEEKCLDISKEENKKWLKKERIQKRLNEGAKNISDLFIENDRKLFAEHDIEEIADYIKNKNILKLKE